ncbi:uncharacterized protein N7498_009621 [Penicillium cinerascens]|uniref:Uncharacterized protein n=1 Tax=Penicillium cinerascens TaxID=70096 RepID=A0A9W9JAA6_9EURO|nr:uncharacterized protein N7498_009621 [Penicillium cinerascens]KAJ5190636.1 hypothetical protein N7498_009621 [Penicillium cinerascens]
MTTRQLLVLADKGWTDTVAIALHVIGGLVSPLQALLLSSRTIKVVGDLSHTEIFDIFTGGNARWAIIDGITTSPLTLDDLSGKTISVLSAASGARKTLASLSSMSDPFLCPLPMGYNTGILRRFAPRLNSSAEVTYMQPSDFPSNCSAPNYGLQTQYSGAGWGVEACAPDFTEVLYLNVTLKCDDLYTKISQSESRDWCFGTTLLEITARMRAGWFELPNYINAGVPGPLQAKDPIGLDYGSVKQTRYSKRDLVYATLNGNLEALQNPGPLLIMAWAIFAAPSSYMATCTIALNDAEFINHTDAIDIDFCSLPPLWNLLYRDFTLTVDPIQTWYPGTRRDWSSFVDWLMILNSKNGTKISTLNNAFTGGLFLANEVWMERVQSQTVTVYSDPGQDTVMPNISLGGMVVISTLLVIYLVALLSIATYAAVLPRWTESMNGFAMMRIGSIAEKAPLLVTYREDDISALDDTPGWIGGSPVEDQQEVEGEKDASTSVATLQLGASCRLRAK